MSDTILLICYNEFHVFFFYHHFSQLFLSSDPFSGLFGPFVAKERHSLALKEKSVKLVTNSLMAYACDVVRRYFTFFFEVGHLFEVGCTRVMFGHLLGHRLRQVIFSDVTALLETILFVLIGVFGHHFRQLYKLESRVRIELKAI